MSILHLEALFLGIVQGLTEFLPISSSAHLILVPWFFKWNSPLLDSLTFDVALHAGTLAAILWYFWKDWLDLAHGFLKILRWRRMQELEERLIVYIIFSTIPAAVAGVLLEETVERSFRNPTLIIFPLVTVSFLMIYAERLWNPSYSLEKMTFKDSLIIGFAQALALLPGVSRSGITITSGIFLGYQREAAMRFSFLLSTPVIAGAAVFKLRHLLAPGGLAEWPVFAIGLVSSALVGYLSIAFLMRYLARHTLNAFAGYRLVLSAIIAFWIWKG